MIDTDQPKTSSTEEKKIITLKHEILNVSQLVTKDITIPDYQRPYKWTTRHVNQLIDDIIQHQDKSAYRLGTIVFHAHEKGCDIVDGQQRSITLTLIMHAIKIYFENSNTLDEKLKNELAGIKLTLIESNFSSEISKYNLQQNFAEIQRRIIEFDGGLISFIMEKCQVVCFYINDVSEAFQFFDAQNARGKDLYPHDLLKAFHLREMIHDSEEDKLKAVAKWESMDQSHLTNFFAKTLYRIRNWSKDDSARVFTKSNINVFKGINVDRLDEYAYSKIHKIAHFYVDAYNNELFRRIDNSYIDYPFQLNQSIINGRRFFEMVSHYYDRHKTHYGFQSDKENKESSLIKQYDLDEQAREILRVINSYDKRHRTGDQYVRNLFDCALMYYIDKFGYVYLSQAIKKLFVWAYKLRLNQHAIQLATMDNYALGDVRMFRKISEATSPKDIINIPIEFSLKNKKHELTAIEELFTALRY